MKLLITLIFIISTVTLGSCGEINKIKDIIKKKDSDPRQFKLTNPEFVPLVDEFARDFYLNRDDNINLTTVINFGDVTHKGKSVIGICYSWSSGFNEIIIKREFWDQADYYDKKVLVYHELGHCALGLPHDDSMICSRYHGDRCLNKRPLSIMNTYHIGFHYTDNTDEEYNIELFTGDDSFIAEYWTPED